MDLVKAWYIQWLDNRPLRGGLVTCEIFMAVVLYHFFPIEKREEKVVEFINLHQRGMSVHKYSLDFIKLSIVLLPWFPTLETK